MNYLAWAFAAWTVAGLATVLSAYRRDRKGKEPWPMPLVACVFWPLYWLGRLIEAVEARYDGRKAL
jgi:hypothetical protein